MGQLCNKQQPGRKETWTARFDDLLRFVWWLMVWPGEKKWFLVKIDNFEQLKVNHLKHKTPKTNSNNFLLHNNTWNPKKKTGRTYFRIFISFYFSTFYNSMLTNDVVFDNNHKFSDDLCSIHGKEKGRNGWRVAKKIEMHVHISTFSHSIPG